MQSCGRTTGTYFSQDPGYKNRKYRPYCVQIHRWTVFFMKMKLKIWELALILALAITLLCGFVLEKDQAAVSDKLIRIHVVANSDSDTDQAVKLVVRDQIIAVLEPLLADCQTKDQAAAKIQAALPLLTAAARETLRQSGAADYSAVATLTQEQFPTRDYESFSLPAG